MARTDPNPSEETPKGGAYEVVRDDRSEYDRSQPDLPPGGTPDGTRRRLIWFVVIWAASIFALGVVAYGIRLLIL
jgi:hypothetical protein